MADQGRRIGLVFEFPLAFGTYQNFEKLWIKHGHPVEDGIV